MMKTLLSTVAAMAMFCGPASADMDDFRAGAVMPDYGKVARVKNDFTVPADTMLKISFDVMQSEEEGKPNRAIEKIARFINMHGEGGIEPAPMRLALVVHGKATSDLLQTEDNPNAGLIEALIEQGVAVIVCGQSLVAYGIEPEFLVDGVEVATSAMTAHAVLQAQGYGTMPF